MAILRKDNVILQEDDKGKIKELKLQGFKEIDKNGKFIEEENDDNLKAAYEKEIEALKEEVIKIAEERDELKKENSTLKGKVTKLEKKVEELEKAPTA